MIMHGELDMENMEIQWTTVAREYCKRHFNLQGNYRWNIHLVILLQTISRSQLGKMIMARQYLKEIHEISQLLRAQIQ